MALGLTLAVPSGRVAGQDPCPGASGPDTEAGWVAYQGDDMAEARSRFEAAIATCGNDQYARTGLGYVVLRDGNTPRATDLFQIVVRAEPNNVDALVGLGLAQWRNGDLDEVRTHFTRVLALAPEHPTAVEYLDRLEGADRAASTSPDAADQAWAAGDTDRALPLYSDRLDADPLDGVAMLRLGLIRAWREEYAAAMELLDLLVDLQPNNVDARLARARVLAWSGDLPAARAEVNAILAVQPDNVDALAALALFQSWSGELDEALSSYDAILSINPEHAAGRLQRAQAMARAAEHEQSLAAFEALVERNPRDLDARLGLARARAFSGDYDGAIAQYDAILSAAPEEMRALTGKARTHGWAGDLVRSERAALRAVDVDDASAAAWGSLGEAYRAQGRIAAAQEAFEAAIRFAPTDPDLRDQLRSIGLALAPVARPTFTAERDSDGNRMLTTSVSTGWHLRPRLDLRADAYHRALEQEFDGGTSAQRRATGLTLSARYQLDPGWVVRGGLGGSVTDGRDEPSLFAVEASVRSPERFPLVTTLSVASRGLDETAALADRGIRTTSVTFSGRWFPAPLWRVDGSVSTGSYEGTESNGRRSAQLGASRRIGRFFSLGVNARAFSFEKNLSDGYFDPDFYGIAEVTSYWLYRPAPWTFLVELAPGVQQVTSDGDSGTSLRSNTRVAYQIDPGRELSLSFGYSSAGLTSFATGSDGYSYTALVFGVNWVF